MINNYFYKKSTIALGLLLGMALNSPWAMEGTRSQEEHTRVLEDPEPLDLTRQNISPLIDPHALLEYFQKAPVGTTIIMSDNLWHKVRLLDHKINDYSDGEILVNDQYPDHSIELRKTKNRKKWK